MKKTALNFCTLLLLCGVAFGQTLTQGDKEKAATYLDETRDGVVAATGELSEAEIQAGARPLVGSGEAEAHRSGRRFSPAKHHRQGHEVASQSSRP